MKDENILDPEDKRVPIHVETYGLGPHGAPVITLSKDGDKKYSTWVWAVAAIIVGISVASFFYNTGKTVVAYFKGVTDHPVLAFANANVNATPIPPVSPTSAEPVATNDQNVGEATSSLPSSAAFKNMGSDDGDTVAATNTDPQAGQYYFLSEDYKLPRTSALAYLVGDIDTGEVIISKNSDMVFPIASVSKLTASLVSEDVLDQHKLITVTRSSVETYGTLGGLVAGEKILPSDLLYPLLMESSNDAAEVLAQGYGRDAFIKLMNDKVKSLGMSSTSYDDPSGLSANNVSTVTDLFTLAKYITKKHPELWDVTRVRGYTILSHSWLNNNDLSRRSSFIGGKNGYTDEADRTTVTVFNTTIGKTNHRIAVIILKSDNRDGDVDTLLRFVQGNVGFLKAGDTF